MTHSHRPQLRLLTLTLATAVAAAIGSAGLPASASTLDGPGSGSGVLGSSIDLGDAAAVIARVAPGLLAETRAPATPAEEQAAGSTGFHLAVPANPAEAIRMSPADAEGAGRPVGIIIGGAAGQPRQTQGVTAFASGASGASASYVQPIANGARFMTALSGPEAGSDFSYAFDLPAGSYTTELPGGDTIVSDAAHHYVGSLEQAWATDADGRALETSYRWSGSTLTQHVELPAGTAYPVLMDPTWFYSYDFDVTIPGYHAAYPTTSAGAVDHMLHACFNCYFPITGAPKDYPIDGQILSLNASPFTLLTLTAAPVRVQTANGGAMQFVAQPGHFDGEGSMITFSWYNDPSGYLHLYVHAKVLHDYGSALNILNFRVAGISWLRYWQTVADTRPTGSGGGGV